MSVCAKWTAFSPAACGAADVGQHVVDEHRLLRLDADRLDDVREVGRVGLGEAHLEGVELVVEVLGRRAGSP